MGQYGIVKYGTVPRYRYGPVTPYCIKWVFLYQLVHWGNGVGNLGFWGNGVGRVVAWGHLSSWESEENWGNWGNWGNWVVLILSCCPVPDASRV